jgi:hypothetical protein
MNAWAIIGGAGLLAVVGLGVYAYSRDSKDPLGVLEDIWNDTFVEGSKFIVPKSLRTKGGIIPRNFDKRDVTKGLKFDRPVDKMDLELEDFY